MTNQYVNSECFFIHGIPEAILEMLAAENNAMAAECGYSCASYHTGYLETTSIGINMTEQLVLPQIYIFIKKFWLPFSCRQAIAWTNVDSSLMMFFF